MGNVLKQSVTGIDIPIQKYQTVLYNALKPIWNVNDSNFNMYGRAYRNQDKESNAYTPEVYIGNNEYSDAYFDDTLNGSAFFGLGEVTKVTNADVQANVFVIFMVNLSKIKNGATRNDEEARIDVERIALTNIYGFFLTGIITGIDQVFKEYSGYKAVKGIKFRDMQPWHCFRLNFQVNYNIYDCN
jgi:hypothetical protein